MINRPMRILLIEASGRGFLNHYSHALAYGLHLCGVEVQLLTGCRDELSGWEVPYYKQACLKKGRSGWRCIKKYISAEKPDVVHLQWIDNPLVALRLVRWAKRQGIKVVYTPHNILPHEKRWILMPIYRILYRNMDKVVARDLHLSWALEELLDIPKDNIEFLPGSPNFLAMQSQGRDVDSHSLAKAEGETRLLFFGHGCSRKGLDILFETISEHNWSDHLHLVVAGEGVLNDISQDLIKGVKKVMRLTLIDNYIQPDKVADLFRDADVLLMPYVKLCKSPLLDLAAAFKLPVLRSNRVQGSDFQEGRHGVTYHHENYDDMTRLLKNTDWINKIKCHLETPGSPVDSMKRLALGHKNLYNAALNESSYTPDKPAIAKVPELNFR